MNAPDHLAALRVNPDWAKLPLFDRSKWQRVRFGDVVENLNETCDPAEAGIERYIGLEHLEPGSLHIRSWGNVSDGTTFTRRARPGQVLFGKRRAYQRKVAVASFDAVVSGDIYVLSPKDDRLHGDLLPFLCMSDRFFNHAVGTSAGSLSPRTHWSSLSTFEFHVPPLQQQKQLMDVLRASNRELQARQSVASAARACFQTRLDVVFSNTDARFTSLANVTTKIVDGVHKTPRYQTAGVPFLVIENLNRGPGIDFSNTRYVAPEDHAEFFKRANPERGDVLVSKDGTLGIARLIETDEPFSIFVSLALIKPNRALVNGQYLVYYFASKTFWRHVERTSAGSALKHIHLKDFKSAPFPQTALREQGAITSTLRRMEEMVESLEAAVDRSRALQREFINRMV